VRHYKIKLWHLHIEKALFENIVLTRATTQTAPQTMLIVFPLRRSYACFDSTAWGLIQLSNGRWRGPSQTLLDTSENSGGARSGKMSLTEEPERSRGEKAGSHTLNWWASRVLSCHMTIPRIQFADHNLVSTKTWWRFRLDGSWTSQLCQIETFRRVPWIATSLKTCLLLQIHGTGHTSHFVFAWWMIIFSGFLLQSALYMLLTFKCGY
jgi:hypothetical protein